MQGPDFTQSARVSSMACVVSLSIRNPELCEEAHANRLQLTARSQVTFGRAPDGPSKLGARPPLALNMSHRARELALQGKTFL
jgi:hypothetical protein